MWRIYLGGCPPGRAGASLTRPEKKREEDRGQAGQRLGTDVEEFLGRFSLTWT